MEAPPIGHAATNFETSLIAVAPGSFYVAGLAADMAWLVKEAVSPADAAVTDLSHGRAVLALEGEAAGDVLQKCVAIDLSAFPPGRAAATMIHHIDVLIHRRTETEFRLIVLRSFAEALAEWLLDAGLEEGIGFRRTAVLGSQAPEAALEASASHPLPELRRSAGAHRPQPEAPRLRVRGHPVAVLGRLPAHQSAGPDAGARNRRADSWRNRWRSSSFSRSSFPSRASCPTTRCCGPRRASFAHLIAADLHPDQQQPGPTLSLRRRSGRTRRRSGPGTITGSPRPSRASRRSSPADEALSLLLRRTAGARRRLPRPAGGQCAALRCDLAAYPLLAGDRRRLPRARRLRPRRAGGPARLPAFLTAGGADSGAQAMVTACRSPARDSPARCLFFYDCGRMCAPSTPAWADAIQSQRAVP